MGIYWHSIMWLGVVLAAVALASIGVWVRWGK